MIDLNFPIQKKVTKFQTCKCKIQSPENECYIGKEIFIFAAPEERPPFGRSTSVIHSKCKNPVDSGIVESWFHFPVKPFLLAKDNFELK